MYGENAKTIAIPIYKVLPYLVIGHFSHQVSPDDRLMAYLESYNNVLVTIYTYMYNYIEAN